MSVTSLPAVPEPTRAAATLVLLRDGHEVGRMVRPAAEQDIESAMSKA